MNRTAPPADAAVLTAAGRGAIAVIGLRGPGAPAIADKAFAPRRGGPLSGTPPRSPRLGSVNGPRGEEVVAVVVGQDPPAVEFQCHGGPAAVRLVLDALERAGATIASAERWVRSGGRSRIEADAELALAEAPTERAATILLDQADGAFATEIRRIADALPSRPGEALDRVAGLIDRAAMGLRLRCGWTVALVGRPNVGKSRLLNALAGYDRAIVSPTPGTTRDLVTAATALDGWPVTLIDTAGLRDSADLIESRGVDLARRQQGEADVVLVVLDRSEALTDEDRAILAGAPRAMRVANKADLAAAWDAVGAGAVQVSATRGDGLGRLLAAVVSRLVPVAIEPGAAVPFEAHHVRRLARCRQLIERGRPEPARCALLAWIGSLSSAAP
jgi:tRNA modification GTPase